MITINYPINDESSLTTKANMILDWIPGARQWLDKALSDPAIHYAFGSESALLKSILKGLYSTELMSLENCDCSAAPEFLMHLSGEQLQLFDQRVNGNNKQAVQAQFTDLLEQLGIVTGNQLIQVQNLFHQWQVNENFIFQSMSMQNVQALYVLASDIATNKYHPVVVKGALNFALRAVVDPGSFARLMSFALSVYSTLCKASTSTNLTTTIKNKFNTIYNNLLGFALERLACPQLHVPQTASDVGAVLKQWTTQKKFIGFNDLPTALLQFSKHIDHQLLLNTTDLANKIADFDKEYLQFLGNARVTRQTLTPDAKNWRYKVESKTRQAEFILVEDGCLTLDNLSNK